MSIIVAGSSHDAVMLLGDGLAFKTGRQGLPDAIEDRQLLEMEVVKVQALYGSFAVGHVGTLFLYDPPRFDLDEMEPTGGSPTRDKLDPERDPATFDRWEQIGRTPVHELIDRFNGGTVAPPSTVEQAGLNLARYLGHAMAQHVLAWRRLAEGVPEDAHGTHEIDVLIAGPIGDGTLGVGEWHVKQSGASSFHGWGPSTTKPWLRCYGDVPVDAALGVAVGEEVRSASDLRRLVWNMALVVGKREIARGRGRWGGIWRETVVTAGGVWSGRSGGQTE